MRKRGTVIAFSGAIGVGTAALSTDVASLLGWPSVRFSDFIRIEAKTRGEDPEDRGVLQRIGQELVRERLGHFVSSVLSMADWRGAGNLIVDGVRHVEVLEELRRQLRDSTTVYLVHIEMDDQTRADRAKRADGFPDAEFIRYDRDITEAQMQRVLPSYADLTLDGTSPRGELAELIVKRFVASHSAPAVRDDGEADVEMEPLIISSQSPHLAELVQLAEQLANDSRDFATEVPIGVRGPLADLVRAMNCYYSNLIEGHQTGPEDIERALKSDYSADSQKRYLQVEAVAHIAVQAWIDRGGLEGQSPVTEEVVRKIHDRFCSELPPTMLWVENPDSKERTRVLPGEYRQHGVKVARHVGPSPGSIPRFMRRFASVYGRLRGRDELLAAAAAHHRLLWIHPFGDGNGRVARLMSHAVLSQNLQTHSIWSVARGLAHAEVEYKAHLAACDLTRRNDLDGRGNLSEEALADFTRFFLETCLEQVRFMRDRLRLDQIQARLKEWVADAAAFEHHPLSAERLLSRVLLVGALARTEALEVLGDQGAEKTLDQLIAEGVLIPESGGAGLTFSFPAKLAGRLLPGLFP